MRRLSFLDHQLVRENAGLVEWPVVLMGTIDARFMDLPPEVLRSAMRTHQRYFGCLTRMDRPAPRFVMVANTETENDSPPSSPATSGCCALASPMRASSGTRIRQEKLEEYLPALEGVVFHARLGSMAEKAQRIDWHARSVRGSRVPIPDQATRAGILCKADLVTEMVGEFPDLQGIMGRYYAWKNEVQAVYEAIAEHYAPRGPSEACPTAPVSVAVALADKLDTLAGFFAIDERPTGSKDPFALRRAALGVIRLIVENKLRLAPQARAERRARWLQRTVGGHTKYSGANGPRCSPSSRPAQGALRDQGKRHDLVNAVFGVGDDDDLVRLLERIDALEEFLNTRDGANLLTAYRRAANILRIEEKKDGERYDGPAEDRRLFVQDEGAGPIQSRTRPFTLHMTPSCREIFGRRWRLWRRSARPWTPSSITSRSTARTPRAAATGC